MPLPKLLAFGKWNGVFYTCDEEWRQDEEIALFDMSENGSDVRLMNEIQLNDILTEHSPKLIYVYDFLSMWTFFVELADIVEKEDAQTYPNTLFSFGELPDSPPEKSLKQMKVNSILTIPLTITKIWILMKTGTDYSTSCKSK